MAINKNMLSPTGFSFSINKAESMEFFVQSITLPGVNLPYTDMPTPFKKIPVYGDHIEYETLEVTFKINEDMSNYLEIFDWITAIGFPEEFEQFAQIENQDSFTGRGIYSDASIMILSSARNPLMRIDIVDMFPIALTPITVDSKDTDIAYIEATASFKFSNYRFTKV